MMAGCLISERVEPDVGEERSNSMDNGASSYRRFLEGDDTGIVEIIRDYKDGLMLFLNRYVNNIHIAEELTEETFVRIVTRKPRFVAKYSFKTWLYTIGRNIAINYKKREGKIADTSIGILCHFPAKCRNWHKIKCLYEVFETATSASM